MNERAPKSRKIDSLVHDSSVKKSEKAEATETKKLFYVHHKVGPHLLSSSAPSRVPRRELLCVNAHGSAVNRIQWCSSKEFSHLLASASMDTTVKIWNLFSTINPEKELCTLKGHFKAVRDVKWSSCGREIVTCGYDGKIVVWDIEKCSVKTSRQLRNYVTCVAYHPTNQQTFVTGTRNALHLWDPRLHVDKPAKEFKYKDDIGQVQDVLFINDGQQLASCGDILTRDSADRKVMVWDYRMAVVLSNQIYQEPYTCTRLVAHPEDGSVLVQSNGNHIVSFSTQRPYKINKMKKFEGHRVYGYNIGCDKSPDGRIILSGSADGKLIYYDYYTTKVMRTVDSKFDICLDVVYHPVVPGAVAACSWDGRISLWQ